MAIKTEDTGVATNPMSTISGLKSATMAYEETAAPMLQSVNPAQPILPTYSTTPTTASGIKSEAMAAQEAGVQQVQIEQAAQAQTAMQEKSTTDQEAAKEIIQGGAGVGAGAPTTGGGSGAAGTGAPPVAGKPGDTTKSGGGGAASTPTPTTSGGTPETGTTTESAWKPYADQAAQMKFSWNSATDPDYLQEASNLENQVAQMMVGRGGLYSSVYQSALQSRLTELQSTMRQEKYQEFLQERTWLMQQAEFYADREDAEFSKNMQMLNYQLDLDNQKFNQQMARAELRIKQQNAQYQREVANAQKEQQAQMTQLRFMTADYQAELAEYTRLDEKWKSLGRADAEIAAYFGEAILGDPYNKMGATYLRQQASNNLSTLANQLAQYSKQVGDSETYLAAITGFRTEQNGEDESKYETNYSSAYNSAVNAYKGGMTWTDIYNKYVNNSTILNDLGATYYNKLMDDLNNRAIKELEE